jgi:5S rRNA maturation endonuclease (ribonuclease M5)
MTMMNPKSNSNFILNYSKDPEYVIASELLQSLDQLYCWRSLLGYDIKLGDKILSPFRIDNNPNCILRYAPDGNILFSDLSRGDHVSIIEAVKRLKNLSYIESLNYLSTLKTNKIYHNPPKYKNQFRIIICPYIDKEKNPIYFKKDKEYWSKRLISSNNLKEDLVYRVKKFKCNSKKNPYVFTEHILNELCYSYIVNNKIKLHFVETTDKSKRFISECGENEIGNLDNLPLYGNSLIISKSYKECRIIRNINYNAIWVQGESIDIPKNIKINLLKRFKNIFILYDNDESGYLNAKKLKDKFNKIIPDSTFSGNVTKYNDLDDFMVDKQSYSKLEFEIKKIFPNIYK